MLPKSIIRSREISKKLPAEFINHLSLAHFVPTDAIYVAKGSKISDLLTQAGYDFLFYQKKFLASLLFFNRITLNDLEKPAIQSGYILLNHPKMYLQKYHSHPCFLPHRNRSFTIFEAKAHSSPAIKYFDFSSTKSNNKYKILDIGCGTGRAILELQNRFRNAEITGLSLPGEAVDLNEVGQFFEIEMLGQKRPSVIEFDLNKGSVAELLSKPYDFVFSIACLRYVRDKINLIEDIYRLLRPNGLAILQLQLLKIYGSGNKSVGLDTFFNKPKWQGIIRYDRNTCLLYIFKSSEEFDFGLRLSEEKTRFTSSSPDPRQNAFVGWTSVYKLKGSA